MVNDNNFALGLIVGYFLAGLLSQDVDSTYIGDTRIHHYWASLGALFTDNEFLQGLAIGVGVHDLPDFIEDLGEFLRRIKD
ncbi:MAG: hypothetical protein ACE5I5_13015 [Candidatus Heimdallarchaeota archaeon]